MKFIKQLFCKHDGELIFISNIHGEWIFICNGRSQWRCEKCGKTLIRKQYVEPGFKDLIIIK